MTESASAVVERVAAEIVLTLWVELNRVGPGKMPDAEALDRIARAAIRAMREPTRRMLDAAAKAMSPAKRPTPERVSVRDKHRIRYRAMIDAALSEPAASADARAALGTGLSPHDGRIVPQSTEA